MNQIIIHLNQHQIISRNLIDQINSIISFSRLRNYKNKHLSKIILKKK